MDPVVIVALILGIIAVIAIIAFIIIWYTDRGFLLQNGTPWAITTGSGVTQSFVAGGNDAYIAPSGQASLIIQKPNFNNTNGLIFLISNLNNANTLTVSGATGIGVSGGTVGSSSAGWFIWNSNSSIQRVA
jgi:hypothetical protein